MGYSPWKLDINKHLTQQTPSTSTYWLLDGAESLCQDVSFLESSLICLTPVSFSPGWATVAPTPSGDFPRPQQVAQDSIRLTTFAIGPWTCEILCELLAVKSLFPTILWSSYNPMELLKSNSTGLQSQMLWVFFFPVLAPCTRGPDVRLRILSPVWETL